MFIQLFILFLNQALRRLYLRCAAVLMRVLFSNVNFVLFKHLYYTGYFP